MADNGIERRSNFCDIFVKWQKAKGYLPFSDLVTEDDVFRKIMTSHAHLWCGNKSAGVTEVTDTNMLHIWIAGGSLDELLDMLPDVEAFAKAMQCDGVELSGRKGWKRIFTKHGYTFDGQRMVKAYGRQNKAVNS